MKLKESIRKSWRKLGALDKAFIIFAVLVSAFACFMLFRGMILDEVGYPLTSSRTPKERRADMILLLLFFGGGMLVWLCFPLNKLVESARAKIVTGILIWLGAIMMLASLAFNCDNSHYDPNQPRRSFLIIPAGIDAAVSNLKDDSSKKGQAEPDGATIWKQLIPEQSSLNSENGSEPNEVPESVKLFMEMTERIWLGKN